jgi:hypothetical protein
LWGGEVGKQTTTTTLKCFLRAKEECGDDEFFSWLEKKKTEWWCVKKPLKNKEQF